MARYAIFQKTHQPISMETWTDYERAAAECEALNIGRPRNCELYVVREVPEQISVSFGTPPTGGK